MVLPGQAVWRRTSSRTRPTRRTIAARTILGAIALTSAATACSLHHDGTDSKPPPPTGLGPGAPTVGQCRVLEAFELQQVSDRRPPVPCTQPHTSITIKVGEFALRDLTSANIRNGVLGKQAQQGCTAALPNVVGGDLTAQRTSLLRVVTFLPTGEQVAHHARWYRCDLVAGGQHGLALQDLPARAQGILDGAVPTSLQACWTSTKLTAGREVPCSRQHVMRAVGVAALPGPTYPGPKVLRTASAQSCKRVVLTWLHGRFFSGYSYEWPSAAAWRRLQVHSAVCWAVTTT